MKLKQEVTGPGYQAEAATIPVLMKTKLCAHCQREHTTLYRIQTQAGGKSWVFVCESCCINAKPQPGYRYGGTWQGYRH